MRRPVSSNVSTSPQLPSAGAPRTPKLQSRRQTLAGLVGGAFGVGALAFGCGLTQAPPLRIGLSLFPAYELVFLAQELGYFRDAGVSVRLVEYAELADARRAYEQGKLDGLQTTLVDVLAVRNAGVRDLQIVRAVDSSEGADLIVASSSVRAVTELSGGAVAVEAESVGELLLARALEHHAVPFESVQRVALPQHLMASALRAGKVRAAVTYSPFSTEMLNDPDNHMLFSSSALPGEILDVHAFDGAVLDARPGDVRAFLAAVARAHAYHAAHPREACEIMAPRESMSATELCTLLSTTLVLIPPPGASTPRPPRISEAEALARAVAALRRTGMLSDRPEIAACLRLQ